jgi:hypothetical protein
MSNSDLNNILSTRFEGHTSTPSESVWSGIEAGLIEDEQKKKAIWFWFTGGIAAASVIGFILYGLIGNAGSIDTQINPVAEKIEVTKGETSDKTKEVQQSTNEKQKQTTVVTNNENEQKSPAIAPLKYREPNPNLDLNDQDFFRLNPIEGKPIIALVEEVKIEAELTALGPIDNGMHRELEISHFPEERKNRSSRWEVGLNVIGFVNTTPYSAYTADEISSTALPLTDPGPLNTVAESSHRRYLEINGYIQKQISPRINAGVGVSASRANSGYSELILNGTAEYESNFERNYWAFGIPVTADFAFIQKGKLSVKAGISVQPEFRFISRSIVYESNVPPNDIYTASNAFEAQENSNYKRFHIGLQPTLGVDYYVTTRMKLSLQAGYITYLFRDDYLRAKGVEPNYITASVGIGWIL